MSGPDTGTLFGLPGPKRSEGTQVLQLRRAIEARVAAGLLDADLYAAEIALALDAALALDNPLPGTKLYALTEARNGYLNILDRLPRPAESSGSVTELERALSVIQGTGSAA
jgi:hypothetical protein